MYAYQVKYGDTPKEITRQFTGNGDRVGELITANPQKSWEYLFGHATFTTLNTNELLVIPDAWLAIGLAGVVDDVGVGRARTKQLSGFDDAGTMSAPPSPSALAHGISIQQRQQPQASVLNTTGQIDVNQAPNRELAGVWSEVNWKAPLQTGTDISSSSCQDGQGNYISIYYSNVGGKMMARSVLFRSMRVWSYSGSPDNWIKSGKPAPPVCARVGLHGLVGVGEAAPAQNTALRAQLGDANSWRTNLADSSPDDGTKNASYLTSIKKSQETAQEATRIAGVAANKWPNRVDIKASYTAAGEDEKYIREIILPAANSSSVSEMKSFADSAWAKAREAVEKAELAETLATSTPNEGGPVPTGGYSFDTHGCLTGAGVKHLQNTLHALGFYDGPIDGVYTYKTGATWAAVTKFQAANGLTVDGCAGKGTMAKLDNVLAGKPPQTAPTPAPAPAPRPPAPVPGPTPDGPGADPVAYTTAMDWTPWLIGGAALIAGGALVVYMRKQQAAGHPVHLPKQLTAFTKRLGKRSRIRKGRR